jgi:hypothetical protein
MPRLSVIAALVALAALCLPTGSEAGAGAAPLRGSEEWRLLDPLRALFERHTALQVRIEQRMVVRIAPQPMGNRQELAAQAFERAIASRYEERRMSKCIPLEAIAGVQTGSGNRIVLFLRDTRMVSVTLDKSCRARDFYSGFYVERPKDGRLCIERDQLRARTGATCEIERLRQLVEIDD